MSLLDNTTLQAFVGNTEGDAVCRGLGIPSRLHRMGREVDNDFAPGERLFRWFVPLKDITEEGWIWTPMSGTMSVNRERYSRPVSDRCAL